MQIKQGIVYSIVNDSSPDERQRLSSFLSSFEQEKDEEPKSLLLKDKHGNLAIYTGLIPFLLQHGFEISSENPFPYPKLNITVDENILNGCTLRDYQISATKKQLRIPRGTIQIPTGGGKTNCIASIIAHMQKYNLAKTALILVPSGFLMEQTAIALEQFGLGPVGRVGYGYHYKKGRDIYVSIIDSAYRCASEENCDWITKPDILIIDELHHGSSLTWVDVISKCHAPYRWGYTATVHDNPQQYSYRDLVLFGLIGPVIFEVKSKDLRARGVLADPIVTWLYPKSPKIPGWSWTTAYNSGIVYNKTRNSMIVSLAHSCYEGGYKTLIFVGRLKHGHNLAAKAASLGAEVLFIHGGAQVWRYSPSGLKHCETWSIDELGEYVNSQDRAILIGTQTLDEGVNLPELNVLIMATGMKKYRRTIQRIGRGMRPKSGDNKVFIFDFWDANHKFLEIQSEYRKYTYSEEEFDVSKSLVDTKKLMKIDLKLENNLFNVDKSRSRK